VEPTAAGIGICGRDGKFVRSRASSALSPRRLQLTSALGRMTLHDFLLFSAMAVVVAVATHWFVLRYWLAVPLSAFVSSLANKRAPGKGEIPFLFQNESPGLALPEHHR